jgi:hypothetical protein
MAKIFDRNNARATAANPDGKQRGPNGRRLCRWCGTEVTPPRRTFCGDDCVHEWSVRSSAAYARTKVWERDKGVCALCGVNTAEQRKHLREEFEVQGFRQQPSAEKSKAFYARLRALKISASRWITADHQGCWDVDHATPVRPRQSADPLPALSPPADPAVAAAAAGQAGAEAARMLRD